jgi:hypothetical protein
MGASLPNANLIGDSEYHEATKIQEQNELPSCQPQKKQQEKSQKKEKKKKKARAVAKFHDDNTLYAGWGWNSEPQEHSRMEI